MRVHALILLAASAAPIFAQTVPTWRLTELWRVGGAAEGPHAFDNVRDIKALGGGQLVILDSKGFKLHVLDSLGRPVRSFGGRGAGPGELSSSPRGLAVAPNGQIVLNDPSNGRFTVYAPTGDVVRTVRVVRRPAFGIGVWLWDAVIDRTGRLAASVGVGGQVQRGGAASPTMAIDSALMAERWAADFSHSDSAVVCSSPPPVSTSPASYTIQGKARDPDGHGPPVQMMGWQQVPFMEQEPYFARDRDGFEWGPESFGSGVLLRRESGKCGAVLARVTLRGPRAPIPKVVRDSQVSRVPAEIRSRVPTEYMWYRALRVDDANRLWVERQVERGTRFDLFSADGKAVAEIAAPAGLLRSLPFVVADGRLTGFLVDGDGVGYLVAWRVGR